MMKLYATLAVAAMVLPACKDDPLPAFTFDKCDGSAGFQGIRQPVLCGTSKARGVNMVIGVALRGTDLVAEITNYEVGTKISSGTIKPREQGDSVTVPIGDELGAVTLDHLKGKQPIDLGVSLTIDSPRYADAVLPLPPMSVASVFYDAETAERLLVTQKLGLGATAPAKRSVYIATRGYVLGDATSLAELDWVALPTSKGMDESEKCAYATEDGQRVDVTKNVEVYTVKLVDRRSGQVIETRDFRAIGECPGFISNSTIRIEFDSVSWKAVETWLAEKLTAA